MSDSSNSIVNYKSLSFLGYPWYRVGDDGSVWSNRKREGQHGFVTGPWKKLKAIASSEMNYGHTTVGLYSSPYVVKVFYIHHLVLFAFVGPCPEGLEGCHNDGDATNNNLSNLRWDTHLENEKDKEKHGTKTMGESHGNHKLTEKQVLDIRKLNGKLLRREIAKLYDVSPSTINEVINRKIWKHI